MRKRSMFLAVVVAGVTMNVLSAPGEPPKPQGKWAIEPFNYRGVSIDGGMFKKNVDEVREYYLKVPNDDLLKGFRKRAGLPAPGNDLGGWYSDDVFHVFGQIISGLSRLHAGTGDKACREKVDTLLAEWGKCIAKDGFFFYSAKPNAPHYIYEKTVCGLVDAYLYCGNKDALGYLGRITDWAMKNLERSRRMGDTGTEWYTLSENLYRAYLATGDVKYRDFAKVWEYTEYWGLYAKKAAIPEGLHAYSHVNTLSGNGAAYRVTGEGGYLDTLKNAYEYLQDNLTYVTGGYGPDEQISGRERLIKSLGTTHNSFETQCGGWAGFKMSKYLIGLTGDGRYGDWVELLAINGVGATLPNAPGGAVQYYSDYNAQGGTKFYASPWTCCSGTRSQAVADYHDLIYFRDAGGLYVNLFTPSTAKWSQGGAEVSVSQATDFPEQAATELTMHLAKSMEFTVSVRVPGWLAKPMTAKLNGKDIAAQTDAQHWARFRRTWSDGDRLTISLPMEFRVSRLSLTKPYPAALRYGPVAMVFDAPPLAYKFDIASAAAELKADPKLPLTWTLAAEPGIRARPFYAPGRGEEYFMYVTGDALKRIPRRAIKFVGQWNDGSQFLYSNAVGATAEASFEGTAVRWVGMKFDDAGKAEVTIDGKVVAVVDQFDPKRNVPFEWTHKGLSPGKHTIRLRILEEKNEKSRSRYVNITGFDIPADAAAKPSPATTTAP